MDTKKILVAVALFAMVASPAFATFFFPMPSSDVEVENENHAYVSNDVTAVAKTGDNEIEAGRTHGCGGSCSCPKIVTGVADSLATVINVVNTNVTRIRR